MSLPPAPYVEDVDSDGSAVPNTRRDAGHHRQPSRPLPHMHKSRRDAPASDSGYSSHASNTVASTTSSQPTAVSQHLRQSSQPVNQAPISRRESQRGQPRPARASSVSQCNTPNCGHPACESSQNPERKFTLPHRPTTQRAQTAQYPVQEPVSSAPHTQTANYQHPQHHASQPAPGYYNPQAEPRQRAPSMSQSRPTSWAPGAYAAAYANHYQQGHPVSQGTYNTQGQRMPPSPSAHARLPQMAQYPMTSGDWQGMPQITSGSPRDSFGAYMPGQMMPTGQAYPPTLQAPFSARQGNSGISSQEISIPSATPRQSTQPIPSARRASIMPGSFPKEDLAFGPPSESSSESSESEDDHDRHVHREQPRRRDRSRQREQERERTRRVLEDRKAMPPPRPVLKHTQTTPAGSRHRSREAAQRSSYSDPHMYVDPERPTRSGRAYSNKGDSRRPIVTQHDKSSRGKGTSRSYDHDVVQRQYVVKDAQGREFFYNTHDEAIAKAERLDQQQQVDDAEAYQASKRGNLQPVTLTAENVKRAQTGQQPKRAASHVSGSSKKSTTSTRMSGSESTIRIERGDDVFNIPADRTVEIITKDGDKMIIGPGSPTREKSYHGSSAGSRTGRSRHGSERGGRRRDTITEEDGYESAL
jgi:hypothetical protein